MGESKRKKNRTSTLTVTSETKYEIFQQVMFYMSIWGKPRIKPGKCILACFITFLLLQTGSGLNKGKRSFVKTNK